MNVLRGDIARLRRCTELITGEIVAASPSPGRESACSPHSIAIPNKNVENDDRTALDPSAKISRSIESLKLFHVDDAADDEVIPKVDKPGHHSTCIGMQQENDSFADENIDVEPKEGELRVIRSKPLKWAYEKEIVMYAYFKKLDYFSTECTYAPNAYRGYARAFLKDLEALRPSAILDIIMSGEAFSGDPVVSAKASIPSGTRPIKEPKALRTCDRCGYISSNLLCKACVLLESLAET
jgi:uncharacterized protein (TIGR00269 family)